MAFTVDNFRERAPEFLYSKLSSGRNALLDAPPGLGKSRGAARVANRLVTECGKRVLIIEPTKTLRTTAADYLREEAKGIDFHISKAWADYICPLNDAEADLCSERKEQCKEEGRKCGVLDDIAKTMASNLTVATFSKLLLSKGLFRGYDTLIIDESHGFENAESSYLQTYVMIKQLVTVSEELKADNPALAEKLISLHKGLSYWNDVLGDSFLLTSREVDEIRKAFDDILLRDAWLSFSRERKYPHYNILYRNIGSLTRLMENISNNVFFFYEGSLFGRPKNMEVEISGFFRDKNVGLLSATIENAVNHARACGLDMRRFGDADSIILQDYPAIRRQNRRLIALSNGPNLGKSFDQYDNSRAQANEIIANLLSKFEVRTLVLFRGYNDQKMAWNYLKNLNFSNRIKNIWRGEDPEVIDEKIKELRSSDIVLSSAAARLWEGVDIPGLRLVIIDALPYPGKDPLDKEYNHRAGYLAMIKKLKQGLGRIVRDDKDWGIALVLDKRFSDLLEKRPPKLPWFMKEDFKRITVDEAFADISKFIDDRRGLPQ
jgi:Rad3-related DNA helicase